jgi:hypothetical protein
MEATPLPSRTLGWRQISVRYPEKVFKCTAISTEILSDYRMAQKFCCRHGVLRAAGTPGESNDRIQASEAAVDRFEAARMRSAGRGTRL